MQSDKNQETKQVHRMSDQTDQDQAYQVLARKYRPATFRDLIGQDALVRTLTNALETNRLHHAFVLTGVRGVGKTTSARIIAKALNCVGPDGEGGPTPDPCGVCESCQAIAQDRHVDVMEMDAASRTGVGDIRELIESVRYRPVSARKKVYIIDEVHMLSNSAFNALLKTLEEPPEHVIFIFATTEIRKVPVTVLSRCQRFDLRRVEHHELMEHFKRILDRESVQADDDSLNLLARAADGSVRDGLSLVDQAIALGGGATIALDQVRHMLGMADRTRVFDLMEVSLQGDCPGALEILSDLYSGGADPVVVIQDLLELSHFLTRAKLVPESLNAPGVPEAERERGGGMAQELSLAVLARTWQLLLKGLEEVQRAPKPLQAAEMMLVRLTHASSLPTPGEVIKKLKDVLAAEIPASNVLTKTGEQAGAMVANGGTGGFSQAAGASVGGLVRQGGANDPARRGDGPRLVVDNEASVTVATDADTPMEKDERGYYPVPLRFADVVTIARKENERIFAAYLANDVHLISYEPGYIEFNPGKGAPSDLEGRLQRHLQEWTGVVWDVRASARSGVETIRQQEKDIGSELDRKAMKDPMVQAVLKVFPGAQFVSRSGLDAGQFVVDGFYDDDSLDILLPNDDFDLDDSALEARLQSGEE
ncbi:DNA polymerase III subunit gamma/tau [Kiloniella sp. b19]|uniref:DNA polymerase III subunit gamma/tau n=1 Tax=Kiloniella sp. GXU_MW_B19 TaxID=3141326 RepID=UPI0031D253EC